MLTINFSKIYCSIVTFGQTGDWAITKAKRSAREKEEEEIFLKKITFL